MADKPEILLEEVLEKLGDKDPTKEIIFESPEWTLLEKHIKDKNFEHDDHLRQLKDDANINKRANAAQIAKELWTVKKEITSREEQKKHNKGARKSRKRIESELQGIKQLVSERMSSTFFLLKPSTILVLCK